MKIINITKVALLAVASMMLLPAQADYPEKPIGVMVAYGPGGATDFQARIATLASGKEALIGQPIYILNKPGAGEEQVGIGLQVKPHKTATCLVLIMFHTL